MANYVIIEFDTSPPLIEIFAPRYTTRESLNTITIVSNEPLADYQDIYTIDNAGNRRNFTLQKVSDTEFTGEIQFSDFSIGIIQLYARMKDDVDNFSNVVSAPIEIKLSLELVRVKVSDRSLLNVKLSH